MVRPSIALLRNAEGTGNVGAQTCGIQKRTGAENLVFGDVGHLDEGIGQNVNGIRDHDVGCIGADSRDAGGDQLQDVDIGLGQFKTGLVGLTGETGGDDNDVASLCVLIIAGIDVHRVIHEGSSVIDVERFTESLFLVDIDKDDFGSDTLECKGVGGCCTDAACADDGDFAIKHWNDSLS